MLFLRLFNALKTDLSKVAIKARKGVKELPKKRRIQSISGVAVLSIVATAFFLFQVSNIVLGATYTFSQTDWSGGENLTTFPVHPGNQLGWNTYFSKDEGIAAATSVTLALTQTTTTDSQFSAGEHNDTQAVPQGQDESLSLLIESGIL